MISLRHLLVHIIFIGSALQFAYAEVSSQKDLKRGIPMPCYKGIDVSWYQGNINWEKVKNDNIKFAFAKASEGKEMKDKTYRKNVVNARKEGIKISAYHYFRFHVPAIQQVNNFAQSIDMRKVNMIPALDIEEDHYNNRHRGNIERVRRNIRRFLTEFERRYHVKMLIYTNEHCYNRYIKGHFDDYPLWVFSFRDPSEFVDKHHVWQYSHKEEVKGIRGKVDMDQFTGNYVDWLKLTFCRNISEKIGRTTMKFIQPQEPRFECFFEEELESIIYSSPLAYENLDLSGKKLCRR